MPGETASMSAPVPVRAGIAIAAGTGHGVAGQRNKDDTALRSRAAFAAAILERLDGMTPEERRQFDRLMKGQRCNALMLTVLTSAATCGYTPAARRSALRWWPMRRNMTRFRAASVADSDQPITLDDAPRQRRFHSRQDDKRRRDDLPAHDNRQREIAVEKMCAAQLRRCTERGRPSLQ